MANNCYYEMKVTGKKEDIDRLFNILKYKDEELKLARIFSADLVDIEDKGEESYAFIAGDCAWSVHSCMRTGEGTYSEYTPELTNIRHLSEVLGLEIEIISDEPGIGFCEHYYYKNGEELLNDCIDYPEFDVEDEECDFEPFGDLVDFEYIDCDLIDIPKHKFTEVR